MKLSKINIFKKVRKNQVQFVLQMCSRKCGLCLMPGWSFGSITHLTLSVKRTDHPSLTSDALLMVPHPCMGLCVPPFSMLRLCLVGVSAGLLHALITNESSYVRVVTAGVLTAEALFYLKNTIPCHHPPPLPLTIRLPLPFCSDP